MWSRAIFVGSLALSHQVPFASVTKTTTGAAASSPSASSASLGRSSAGGNTIASPSSRTVAATTSSASKSALYASNKNQDESEGSCSTPIEIERQQQSSSNTQSQHQQVLATSSPMTAAGFTLERYHLIWSPGAWKKVLGTTAVMMLLPRIGAWNLLLQRLPSTSSTVMGCGGTMGGWYTNIVLPLAASSCCLIQLGLNVLSVGCAGWNSYLGPVRPYFMGILLVTSLRHPPPAWSTLLWRAGVALLPEAVHLYNTWAAAAPPNGLFRRSSSNDHDQQQQQHLAALEQFVLEVDIPTMGCVACIQTIDASLRKIPGVVRVASQLKPLGAKGGQATVHVATSDATTMTNTIIDAVANAGFNGAYLTSLRPKVE